MANEINEKGQFVAVDEWEYFRNRYEIDEKTGCWNWTKSLFEKGYGIFKCKSVTFGKAIPASRASWILHFGDPGKLFVCHKCDNRRCVNPSHLFLGTQVDNMTDASEKRRINHGEDRPQSKLTEENVREIRRLRQSGMGWLKLAKKFGVNQSNIISAAMGKTWSHVDEPIPTYIGKPGNPTLRRRRPQDEETFGGATRKKPIHRA